MKRPTPPCDRWCKERTMTCKFDGTCDKYKGYKEELEAFNKYVKNNMGIDIKIVEVTRAVKKEKLKEKLR